MQLFNNYNAAVAEVLLESKEPMNLQHIRNEAARRVNLWLKPWLWLAWWRTENFLNDNHLVDNNDGLYTQNSFTVNSIILESYRQARHKMRFKWRVFIKDPQMVYSASMMALSVSVVLYMLSIPSVAAWLVTILLSIIIHSLIVMTHALWAIKFIDVRSAFFEKLYNEFGDSHKIITRTIDEIYNKYKFEEIIEIIKNEIPVYFKYKRSYEITLVMLKLKSFLSNSTKSMLIYQSDNSKRILNKEDIEFVLSVLGIIKDSKCEGIWETYIDTLKYTSSCLVKWFDNHTSESDVYNRIAQTVSELTSLPNILSVSKGQQWAEISNDPESRQYKIINMRSESPDHCEWLMKRIRSDEEFWVDHHELINGTKYVNIDHILTNSSVNQEAILAEKILNSAKASL